jgi:hypothetical protein
MCGLAALKRVGVCIEKSPAAAMHQQTIVSESNLQIFLQKTFLLLRKGTKQSATWKSRRR